MAEPAPVLDLERADAPRVLGAPKAPKAAVVPLHPGLAVARGYARARMDASDDPGTARAVESEAWLRALRASGPERDRAVRDLHALLLGAARFEVGRRRAALARVRGEELDDLALQAADDATVAVLAKLDDFRGASRFTTWAYKFALLEAGVRLRRRAFQEREVVLDGEGWERLASRSSAPAAAVEQAELLEALRDGIAEALTAHQRRVFVALALNETPVDVLSEQLATTRGALYKTLHDARRKLRDRLVAEGHFAAAPAADTKEQIR
jgi:RNA polymerase sigma-70 factor, ECF subfamily